MEYHIFRFIKKIHPFFRIILAILLIIFAIFAWMTPMLGAIPATITLMILFVDVKNLKTVRKLRKSLTHMINNILHRKRRSQKWHDIKKHLKHIFKKK